MKAVVCRKYGSPDFVTIEEVPVPVPGDSDVLVKVKGSSVNYNSAAHVTGIPFAARMWFGMRRPKLQTPGNDFAGIVETVGKNVTTVKPGDEVFGDSSECGFGAWAEYAVVNEEAVVAKPKNLSWEEAAGVPEASIVALQGLRAGGIEKGKKVLVYGASGGIGCFTVQMAKTFGAQVTGVCSTRNGELVGSLGADSVIDYTKEDFTRNGLKYDLILATAGYRSLFDYRRALADGGRFVATGGSMKQVFQSLLAGPLLSLAGSRKLGSVFCRTNRKDLLYVKELLEKGTVRPVIDKRYGLTEIPEALNYYTTRRARGKVVIAINVA